MNVTIKLLDKVILRLINNQCMRVSNIHVMNVTIKLLDLAVSRDINNLRIRVSNFLVMNVAKKLYKTLPDLALTTLIRFDLYQ